MRRGDPLAAEPRQAAPRAEMPGLSHCGWVAGAGSTANRLATAGPNVREETGRARITELEGASASRTARMASSGTDVGPLRRRVRSRRATSATNPFALCQDVVSSPAPWPPVPLKAQTGRWV